MMVPEDLKIWHNASMTNDLHRRRTLWLVDDSATDSERVRRLFSRDYDVVSFNDGPAALELLALGTLPDILLLDWVMPGMSGIEVCQFVRSAHGKASQLPIILLTAQHGKEE